MCTIDDLGSSPPLRKETLILIVMCTCRRSDSNARNQQHPRTSLRRAQQVHVPPPPSDALNQHWVYSCAAAAGPGDAARQFHTPPRQFHSSNDGERAEAEGSYSVAVHGRCMIAHSFEGECFATWNARETVGSPPVSNALYDSRAAASALAPTPFLARLSSIIAPCLRLQGKSLNLQGEFNPFRTARAPRPENHVKLLPRP